MDSAPHIDAGQDKGIVIGDDVWIGADSIVLDGSYISEVVGAGSGIFKKFPPFTAFAGNPAKFISHRFTLKDLKEHLHLKQSKLSIEEVIKANKNFWITIDHG